MAYVVKSTSGKKIILRNPAEKATRYARQLKSGKVTETSKRLTKTDKAWRAGYLSARRDNAAAYNANERKKKPSIKPVSQTQSGYGKSYEDYLFDRFIYDTVDKKRLKTDKEYRRAFNDCE